MAAPATPFDDLDDDARVAHTVAYIRSELGLARAEVKSIERKFRIVKTRVARAEEAAATLSPDRPGGHTNEHRNRD